MDKGIAVCYAHALAAYGGQGAHFAACKVFSARYTPRQKMIPTLFAACGRQTLRGFSRFQLKFYIKSELLLENQPFITMARRAKRTISSVLAFGSTPLRAAEISAGE